MDSIRKGIKPDRMPPVIKYLEKNNDIKKLKRIFLSFADEYLDIIERNQGSCQFSFKNIRDSLDTLRLETERFAVMLEKSLPAADDLKKTFKPALTRVELIKMGGIKAGVF